MRILNVTQTYAPFLEFGGPPVKVRGLSEGLARRGHQVTVLTADWGVESRVASGGEGTGMERSPFGWRQEKNGVQAVYLPTWFRYRAVSWNPAAKRFCRARLQNYDVAHIFGVYDFLGPVVATACRHRNIPYVVEPIGMFLPIVRSFRLKRMYHSLLGSAMLKGARFVVATSQKEAAELASAGLPQEKIILRRNGVDAPAVLPERGRFRAALKISPDVKLILFLGRLSQKKSPDVLLKAFAMLPNPLKENHLQLAFVGPDEDAMKARLLKMAEQLGVASRVQFCGALFGEAKWAAYRDADVFVLPSQNENFGNTAAEAAAAGTPVIVTEECGIAPLLADVAGVAVPHDAAAISRAIERLFVEPGLRERLTAGCSEAASRLGWEEPVRAMEALYGQLVEVERRVA
jgi:glycosyltransferase involved in cell wall biosynthesis